MNKEDLIKDKKELEQQLKIGEANLYRIMGAIAFINQKLAELDKPAEDKSETKKKD